MVKKQHNNQFLVTSFTYDMRFYTDDIRKFIVTKLTSKT